MHEARSNLGEVHTRGVLLSKGLKVEQKSMRSILKVMKNTYTLKINRIRQRHYATRSLSAVWHLNSSHKLTKYTFVASGIFDGHSRMVSQIKYPKNNRVIVAHQHFLHLVNEFICSLQVWVDYGTENRLITINDNKHTSIFMKHIQTFFS